MKITQFGIELQIMNEWLNLANEDSAPIENLDESSEIPEEGDTIRTKKMQMDGKVEKIGQNRAGYDEVYFRIADGRLMKTPLDNVIVVQKLADEDHQVFEQELDELSNELLSKYKTTTKEGNNGGINRSAPAQDVSYEKVLDRNPRTAHTKVVGEDILDEVKQRWSKEM